MTTKMSDTFKRYIIKDPIDGTYFTREAGTQWTISINHSHKFVSRRAAEIAQERELFGTGKILTVTITYQIEL